MLQRLRENGIDVRDIRVRGALPRTSPRENSFAFRKCSAKMKACFFHRVMFFARQNEFMIVIVDGDDMRGLFDTAPPVLVEEVARVARSAQKTRPIVVESMIQSEREEFILTPGTPTRIEGDDIVFGGDDHRALLKKILSQATRHIFIHSTFLHSEGFNAWSREFREAARNGVKRDICWGSGTPDDPGGKTMTQATALAQQIRPQAAYADETCSSFTGRSGSVNHAPENSHARSATASSGS